jgi:hypothetical protein
MIELLIDGTVELSTRSGRRFDGAREHGPPHDRFGFLLALPPRGRKRWHRIEVREQETGIVFGRMMPGGEDPALPELLQRIDAVRREAADLGELVRGVKPPADLARVLTAVGAGLRGGGLAPIDLGYVAAPRVSLVVVGCDEIGVAHRAIAALAGPAADLAAEVLLLGDLSRGGLAGLAAVVRELRLIDGIGIDGALDAARGERVLVLDGTRLEPAPDLAAWLDDGVMLGREGLILGIGRSDWLRMAGTEEFGLAAAADVAAQARLLGITVRSERRVRSSHQNE